MPPKYRRPQTLAGNIYPAVPPRPYVIWVWLVLAALCFAAVFFLPKPPHVPLWAYKLEFGGLLAVAILLVWTGFSSVSLRVEVAGTSLWIFGSFFYRSLKADEIDIAAARVVDLDAERDYGVALRLYGASLPGYGTGLYLRRRGGLAWAFLTSRRQVLWLPVKTGKPYLLSLQDSAGLLARLQKYASRAASGGET